MRILGLDLSLTSTGYCLLDFKSAENYPTPTVTWSGAVGSSDLREAERLELFAKWLNESLFFRVFDMDPPVKIDHVAIEGYSYGSPQGSTRAFGIGELGGVVKLLLHRAATSDVSVHRGLEIHIIAANTWKKVLCGKGGLKKDLVRLELFKRYGVEFPSQDTLDAWAVAMCCRRQLLGLDKPEPKVRKRKAADELLEAMS